MQKRNQAAAGLRSRIAQVFLVDDQNHLEREKICFMLENLFQVECINYLIISIEYIIIFRF